MTSKEAKLQLIKEYGKTCFLGGIITPQNQLTVHHIKPVRQGGRTELPNLTLLARVEHDQFNYIETTNRYYGEELNLAFLELKRYYDLLKLKEEIKKLKLLKEYLLQITDYDYKKLIK